MIKASAVSRAISPTHFAIGQAVKYCRKAKKLSQPEFAKVCGFGPKHGHVTVGRIERGRANLSITSLNRVVDACDVDFGTFVALAQIIRKIVATGGSLAGLFEELTATPEHLSPAAAADDTTIKEYVFSLTDYEYLAVLLAAQVVLLQVSSRTKKNLRLEAYYLGLQRFVSKAREKYPKVWKRMCERVR